MENKKLEEQLLKIIVQLENENNEIVVSELLDYAYELLLDDEVETINILNKLDENQTDWISTVFEELSFQFQSNSFINCIEQLSNKFPDNEEIRENVASAKEAIE